MAIIAIDPGKKSGASLFLHGKFSAAWQVGNKAAERQDVLLHCCHKATEAELPIVVVMESWPYIGSIRTAIGLGKAAGRWLEQAELQGIPQRRIIEINVNVWRKGVYGVLHNRIGKEAWKAQAVSQAHIRFGQRLEEDAAEAAMMGLYATMSEEVEEVVPKR